MTSTGTTASGALTLSGTTAATGELTHSGTITSNITSTGTTSTGATSTGTTASGSMTETISSVKYVPGVDYQETLNTKHNIKRKK